MRVAEGEVTVRDAVEAITPDAMTIGDLWRERVEGGTLGDGLVKDGVKDGDHERLKSVPGPRCTNDFQGRGVVERREFLQPLNSADDVIGNFNWSVKLICAMHDTVADSLNTF